MDILYYAKDREPHWEEISINELNDEVGELFEARAKRQGLEFNVTVPENIGNFEADKSAIKSMLINLLDNSLDACRIDKKKENHSINLEIKTTPDNILFEITDNGIGMDRETREKALGLFFSSKGAGGTGLGLFIANKIAESHGGSIKLDSEEGEGCKFLVTMPRKKPNAEFIENQ